MKRLLSSLLALTLGLSLTVPSASALELEEAKELLATIYVDGVSPEILELDSLDAILEAIGDPYTFYMTGEQYNDFHQSVNGQTLVGIGATVENAFHNGYRVMSVLPDSPALEKGLKAGDILVAVNGTELTAGTDPRVCIAGEAGTEVTITILREGARMDLTLTRRSVTVPIVMYEEKGRAGYIECLSFGDTTPISIREAIETMDDHAEVWIMDLRSNPGGSSGSTAISASYFTGGGTMLYYRNGAGASYYYYTLPTFPDLTDKPVIVLTSEHSASGSELFAGDIRSYGAGIALGQRTFGKGTAQLILDERNCAYMVGGEAMKITAYRFFSPDGATNHIFGILPTLLISPDNTMAAAMLLSQPKPVRAAGYLKLELADQTFYIDAKQAVSADSKAAFTELLEALPPSAGLYEGSGAAAWTEVTPSGLAQKNDLTFTARAFSDVSGSPYAREINTLAVYRILDGSAGTFRPGDSITRAQFAAMAASALNLPEGRRSKFSDVDSGSPYAGAINAMADLGFLSGRGDGAFDPESAITVQEAVTVLSKVAAWSSMDGHDLERKGLPIGEFLDYYGWADWARVPARVLTNLEALPEGLTPSAALSREQGAAMLCRLMENIHLIWD